MGKREGGQRGARERERENERKRRVREREREIEIERERESERARKRRERKGQNKEVNNKQKKKREKKNIPVRPWSRTFCKMQLFNPGDLSVSISMRHIKCKETCFKECPNSLITIPLLIGQNNLRFRD